MFSNFRIWSTTETQSLGYKPKSRRSRVTPYPPRLASSDDHPLQDEIQKPLRVPKPMFNFGTISPGPSENEELNGSLAAPEYYSNFAAESAPGPLEFDPPKNQEPDAAASPSPNPHEFGSNQGPPEIQEPNAAARPVPEPLPFGPPKNQEPDTPSPNPNKFGSSEGPPESQEHDAAAIPVPELGPPKNQEPNAPSPNPHEFGSSQGPPEIQEPDAAARPIPEPLPFGPPKNQEPENAASPVFLKPMRPNASPPQDFRKPQFNFNSSKKNNSTSMPIPQLDM